MLLSVCADIHVEVSRLVLGLQGMYRQMKCLNSSFLFIDRLVAEINFRCSSSEQMMSCSMASGVFPFTVNTNFSA